MAMFILLPSTRFSLRVSLQKTICSFVRCTFFKNCFVRAKIESGRRDQFHLKIVEIGVILRIFHPSKFRFDLDLDFDLDFSVVQVFVTSRTRRQTEHCHMRRHLTFRATFASKISHTTKITMPQSLTRVSWTLKKRASLSF